MNSFSEFLEELRKVQRISKRELANKAGLTPGYISHLTRGDRSAPSKETLEALAEALELNDEVRTQFFQKAGFSSAITSSTSAFSIKHVVKDERSITVSQKIGERYLTYRFSTGEKKSGLRWNNGLLKTVANWLLLQV